MIPVIDLFAGPGGLGEGFSSLLENGKPVFNIKLSIEKEKNAHKTLTLRSFYRQFKKYSKPIPKEYYDLLKEKDLKIRELKREELYEKYKTEGDKAKEEAQLIELGSDKFPPEIVDDKIRNALNNNKNWVLIGGPPCQAYSLVGRSRIGGVDEDDHRVYLYREYLRIIARHHPSVFVMENVKGLLSARVDGNKVFSWMQKDLKTPGRLFPGLGSPEYSIFSFVKNEISEDKDYLIKSEDFGVPQKRQRVILLGIKKDLNIIPGTLTPIESKTSLKSVIGKLPKIRSELNRRFIGSAIVNGKKKRIYEKVNDSNQEWDNLLNQFLKEILIWNGFKENEVPRRLKANLNEIGSEFISCKNTLNKDHFLYDWYIDPRLNGVPNHQSRSHLILDLKRYLFATLFARKNQAFPKLDDYLNNGEGLVPDHENVRSGKFVDRFRVQLPGGPATTVTSHISKDGHYFIHYDPLQCRSLTVREAARIQTFPDNYLFCGSRTQQFHQVGNAVPPFLALHLSKIIKQILE